MFFTLQMNSFKSTLLVITLWMIFFIVISLFVLQASHKHPTTPDHASQSEVGYVYALGYWEQQATSLFSLLTLHLWVGQLNACFLVVAPFYHDGWSMTVSQLQKLSAPQFSDLFDLETWNNVTKREYGVELVPWSHLLNKSKMKLITVEIIYWWEKSQDAHGLNRRERITYGCKWKIENDDSMITSLFYIVRRACINYSFGDKLTSKEFNSLVFGGYLPAKVSVIFQEWRGIYCTNHDQFRVPYDIECGDQEALFSKAVASSSMMLKLASTYKQMYLNNSDYIAVMVRLEKAGERHSLPQLEIFLDKVLNVSRNLQYQYGISNILLCMDIGQFGSVTLINRALITLGTSFFEKVNKNFVNIATWEKSFETVAKTTEPAVIARLQSTLVAQSTCAIIAGGGVFQYQTASMYHTLHRNSYSCLEKFF